jgi:DNA-binding response OmpR family regulator
VWRRARPPDLPTILLAEQSAPLRELLGKLLAEEGYRVLGAASRGEVLEHLRAPQRIDLVIADVGLRGMPGWDVVQETAWLRPGVPCVRLIESRADALPLYGIDPAVEVMLQRPVTIVDLLVAIEDLLARAPAADARRRFETARGSVGVTRPGSRGS